MDNSDGSHISSTPPRQPSPPQPWPPQPPASASAAAARTLLFSNKLRKNPKSNAKPSSSRPILKIKPSTKRPKPPPEPQIDRSVPCETTDATLPSQISGCDSFDATTTTSSSDVNLPFQIRRTSGCSSFDSFYPTEILPAGGSCLSRFSSFSKLRMSSLNFKPTEKDIDDHVNVNYLERVTQKHPNLIDSNLEQQNMPDSSDSASVNETLSCRDLGKVAKKKHPNLIGSCVYVTEQVSKPKPVNEGNFVRLNINGHGGRKKFANKVRKRNPNAYIGNRKSYKRSKRKLKSVGEGEEDEDRFCDEGLPMEENERTETRLDSEVIEKAVFDVRQDPSDDNLVKLLKLVYGYDSFRDGQLEAIKLILSRKSSMVILPTGAGKSLCYQLPAMILEGMSLVISPLVALMYDQLRQLPPVIPGGLLCSSQTLEESSETLRRAQEGALKVLFVSPERLLNTEFTSIFSANSLMSLVVIDEAHCISEWSHNFRPSYMRLRASLLRSSLGVGCILAMTATATTKTMHDVMRSLEIPPTNLVQVAQVRDNLQLSLSLSGNRMKDLMALLKASPYTEVKSIIIYCKYQSETDMISKFLCDSNIRAKSYHSGIPAKDRRRTQELFCSNKIRVIVATVAFGMGLNKSDVGAVIHYSLPESLEEYVQEIGRAGRDGRVSYCHLFFDDTTYFKLRSLMYSDGQDQYTVNKFLSQVFSGDSHSQGRICTIVKESASRKFDMKEEVILTILTRLELAEERYLRLLPQTSVTCVLNFHMTSPALLAAKDTVIETILKKSEIKDGQYVFEIPTVASSIGFQVSTVTNHLQNLKLKGEITYELKDPAYCYMLVNFPRDICSLAADLAKWLSDVESCKVHKVDAMFNAALFAVKTCDRTNGCTDSQHTPCLQKKILEYFNADNDNSIPNKMVQTSRFLRADIKVFLQSNSHAKFTPRAIARIMHGIASPAFPSSTWYKTHFWGRYIQTNIDVIMEAAKAELMACAGKSAV
ncbi:putative DNA helicase [Helianthus annuus]|nr:ATP-dependent DNA helicase Q-like 5 [Helianthus annuus]XP_021996610.1 ATP-dependent DNA helicase Q-like 5 [Helianthus annuus]XP_035836613.1 ATP-dependent DNA helicase Q-like 5 [Helianthus annuus]KAF5776292.1 putative DNA helicase [Helianthus annuus]KAJ0488029.1 putative DNA helicase [Helianthus annuus]KAJ0503839.1 putative DNA helicase [Helianthus annuus]